MSHRVGQLLKIPADPSVPAIPVCSDHRGSLVQWYLFRRIAPDRTAGTYHALPRSPQIPRPLRLPARSDQILALVIIERPIGTLWDRQVVRVFTIRVGQIPDCELNGLIILRRNHPGLR